MRAPIMFDAKAWQALEHDIVLFLPRLGTGLLIIFVFWLAAKALQRAVERLTRVPRFEPSLTRYIGSSIRVGLMLFGIVTALALGFALRDIVSNALSGILVLAYRPFRVLDQIEVTGLTGTVTDINLR